VREACSRENIDFDHNSNQCCCKSVLEHNFRI
jgi:hypothetical protein